MNRVVVVFIISVASAAMAAGNSLERESNVLAAVKEIRGLQIKIGVQCLLRQMSLDRDQLRSLFELSGEALRHRARFEEDMEQILQRQLAAFTRFRDEDIINTGFSSEVERETGVANHSGKAAFKRFADLINIIEKRTASILDSYQLSLINSFRVNVRNPRELFRLLQETNNRRGTAVKTSLEIETWIAGEEDVNEMTDKERLRQINRDKYGYIGPVGRFISQRQTYEVLARLNNVKADYALLNRLSTELGDLRSRVSQLRKEINLLNLINGMNFTPEQLLKLSEYASNVEELQGNKRDILAELDPVLLLDIRSNLNEVSAYLAKGSTVPEGSIHEIKRLHQRAVASKMQPFKYRSRSREEQYMELVSSVREILFDNQKETLIGYKACLIPPKDLKDPVRVGQASTNSRYIGMLDKIRRFVTPEMYESKREFILDKIISRAEKHGRFTDEEVAANKEVLDGVIKKVIAMSDAEYEMNKESLSESLGVLDVKKVLEERIHDRMGDDAILAQKIRANLLDPAIVPLLRMRYKQLTSEDKQERTDLDSIVPAENCDNGCAIN